MSTHSTLVSSAGDIDVNAFDIDVKRGTSPPGWIRIRADFEEDRMGERVEFPSNGHTCQGYFAGKGPGIVVIQEWWGLVPHIEEIVDRFAGEGFSAIAPDLFHGKTAGSPDEAGRLLMELDAASDGRLGATPSK